MKEVIVKFLKDCQFTFSKGEVYFSTTMEKFSEFEKENGVDFLSVWDLYSIENKDKLMQRCFMFN